MIDSVEETTPKELDVYSEALLDYHKGNYTEDIIVLADGFDKDIMPLWYMFRSYDQMPKLERIALSLCEGRVLDIGAGAGPHALWLKNNGFDVVAIDVAPGAVKIMQEKGIQAYQSDVFNFSEENKNGFDTLILLMNGIGFFGDISLLEEALLKLKQLLRTGGKIIFESASLDYLFDDNSQKTDEYYGTMHYKMQYKDRVGEPFNWLYIDEQTIIEAVDRIGGEMKIIDRDGDNYLATITY